MKTQEELRADFQRFMDADMLDEAEAVLEQLEPLSDAEWHKWMDEAPLDDEPLTARDFAVLTASDERRQRRISARTG